MRDYSYIDQHLSLLLRSVYPEPVSPQHKVGTQEVLERFVKPRLNVIHTVLDMGCGQGVAAPYFREMGIEWTGITLGEDYKVCVANLLNVLEEDFNFTTFSDESFDLVYARHSLEHSPMPAISLLEFKRIARHFILVVVPTPESGSHYPNHYCLMPDVGWRCLFRNTGLSVFEFQEEKNLDGRHEPEFRYLLRREEEWLRS